MDLSNLFLDSPSSYISLHTYLSPAVTSLLYTHLSLCSATFLHTLLHHSLSPSLMHSGVPASVSLYVLYPSHFSHTSLYILPHLLGPYTSTLTLIHCLTRLSLQSPSLEVYAATSLYATAASSHSQTLDKYKLHFQGPTHSHNT